MRRISRENEGGSSLTPSVQKAAQFRAGLRTGEQQPHDQELKPRHLRRHDGPMYRRRPLKSRPKIGPLLVFLLLFQKVSSF